jgi:hypothetical protein
MQVRAMGLVICCFVASCGSVTKVSTQANTTTSQPVSNVPKRDARLLDIASVETGSDRWLGLYAEAEADCMRVAGFEFVPRTVSQMRGEEASPNSELLAGWAADKVVAWSEALGGKVNLKAGENESSSGGCTQAAQERVWLFSAFPGLQAEVASERAASPSDALYAVLARHQDEVVSWYEQWPTGKAVAA